jgi:quinol monooxygenase YgiN
MTAYNVVRMRVKPGKEQQFLDFNRDMDKAMVERLRRNGIRKFSVVQTGERAYCIIGEWESMDAIVNSRKDMIANLDKMRDLLEDLGSGLGVTDPVSGDVVVEFRT